MKTMRTAGLFLHMFISAIGISFGQPVITNQPATGGVKTIL